METDTFDVRSNHSLLSSHQLTVNAIPSEPHCHTPVDSNNRGDRDRSLRRRRFGASDPSNSMEKAESDPLLRKKSIRSIDSGVHRAFNEIDFNLTFDYRNKYSLSTRTRSRFRRSRSGTERRVKHRTKFGSSFGGIEFWHEPTPWV